MKKLFILIVLLVSLGIANATLLWQQDAIAREGQSLNYEGTVVQDTSGAIVNFWAYQINGHNCLMAAKFSSTGEALWQEPVMVKGGMDLKSDIRATQSSDGGILLSWIERNNLNNYILKLQKLSPSGNNLWGADGISVSVCTYNPPHYLMTSNQDGGAYLFVNDLPYNSLPSHAYAYCYNSSGTDIWSPENPFVSQNGYLELEAIAAPSTGSGMLVIYQIINSGVNTNVFRHFNSAGLSDWNITETGTTNEDDLWQVLPGNANKVHVFNKSMETNTPVSIRTLNLETGAWIPEEASQIMLNPTPVASYFGFKATFMQDTNTVSLLCRYLANEINYISQTLLNMQMQPVETRSIYSTNGRINSLEARHDGNLRTFCIWAEKPAGSYDKILKAQAIADAGGDLLFPTQGITICNPLPGILGYGMAASNSTLHTFFVEPGEETTILKRRAFDSAGNSLLPAAQESLTTILNGYAWPMSSLDIDNHAVIIYYDTRNQDHNRLYYQQFNPNGETMFQPGGVQICNSVSNGVSFFEAIRCNNDRFAVLFSNNGVLYLQIYDLAGNPQFSDNGLVLSPTTFSKARMAVYEADIYISWYETGS
ncbi:MAG: hypothetical protein PHO32_10600, partial [Candidatus Cloacimonetes bacterium]|nr:hypothetical protein [Candidatus Cloacimonadota bacterium]